MRTRLLMPALAFFAAAALVGCGSDDTSSNASGSSSAVDSAAASDLNDADIEFAQGMIAHHEQAIEMAEIALDPTRGARPEVVDLAGRIKAAQDPEVDLMTKVLTDAGESTMMDMSDGHNMEDMEGMMSAQQMDVLGQATGADFDRMWLEMMIEHHEGALSQANAVKASGSNPALLTLADQIIATQQAEIDEMRALLAG